MKQSIIHLHTRFHRGPVDARIFGGFLEHMGRAVYQGVYDPDCIHADADGLRRDVLSALRRLRMTTMRYPGGNFASGYHWQDGVGPSSERPNIRELAWQSIESNQFGTDEYINLCRRMEWTPMITVNLGTGTPEEARNWVEYCNCPPGSKYADQRVANGATAAHGVKLWCLGNEMDGVWQLGHVPAEHYAIRAQQAAKMMRDTDREIELVVCGSCGTTLPSYMEWDRQVLEYMGEFADYISLHRYEGNWKKDTPAFLAAGLSIDKQIEEMDAACRYVQAKKHSAKRPYLCFDEWNVWYKNQQMNGENQRAPHLIEEVYNLEDALVCASFLNSFIRHADVVKIANLAQIVNVIAPILTRGDEMLIQSIFYPFEMMSKRREGLSLQLSIAGPEYQVDGLGSVPEIDASAILDNRRLQIFLTNRNISENAEVEINIADAQLLALESAEILTAPHTNSENSYEKPQTVCAQPFSAVRITEGRAVVEIPPLAFVALTMTLAQ